MEIYFFSGTGNSLHVARELQRRNPEAILVPMVGLLNRNAVKTQAEAVGFVFPTYLTTVPAPVRDFLRIIDLESSRYVFSITTRIGSYSVANAHVAKALQEKHKTLDARFCLNMGNNSPTGLKPVGDKNWTKKITPEKIAELESRVQSSLDRIAEVVRNRAQEPKKTRIPLLESLVESLMAAITKTGKEIPFYADSDCSACGTCAKVCPSGKIRSTGGKPLWSKEVQCFYCYACFNFCPQQSILVGKLYREKNGRYFHPQITADDIAAQKGVQMQ